MCSYIQEAQGILRSIKSMRFTPGHIIIKLLKDKDKEIILRASERSVSLLTRGS